MHENRFGLVGLLDPDADAHAVDTGLDQDALLVVAGNDYIVEQDFGRRPGLDFGDIVAFGYLRGKVAEAQRGQEGRADGVSVRAQV